LYTPKGTGITREDLKIRVDKKVYVKNSNTVTIVK